MLETKYVRIQGRRISGPTGKPGGIFAVGFWQIQDGVFNEKDAEIYNSVHKWFEDNLPNPP